MKIEVLTQLFDQAEALHKLHGRVQRLPKGKFRDMLEREVTSLLDCPPSTDTVPATSRALPDKGSPPLAEAPSDANPTSGFPKPWKSKR
jgi:hypothetical protein